MCHPHISTLDQTNQKLRQIRSIKDPVWCQICFKKCQEVSNFKIFPKIRRKLVMGSSTLAHLWKSNGYKGNCDFHVDFDCIIGGQIHDVHLSFERQYKGESHTVWKFGNFPVTQILREINFDNSRSLKIALFLPF